VLPISYMHSYTGEGLVVVVEFQDAVQSA
jgi:hypothetical protein